MSSQQLDRRQRKTRKAICEGEPHFTTYFESQLDVLFGKAAPGGFSGSDEGDRTDAVHRAGDQAPARCGTSEDGCHGCSEVPAEFLRVLRVGSFSHVVSWWFAGGATQPPEQVAGWYVTAMGVE